MFVTQSRSSGERVRVQRKGDRNDGGVIRICVYIFRFLSTPGDERKGDGKGGTTFGRRTRYGSLPFVRMKRAANEIIRRARSESEGRDNAVRAAADASLSIFQRVGAIVYIVYLVFILSHVSVMQSKGGRDFWMNVDATVRASYVLPKEDAFLAERFFSTVLTGPLFSYGFKGVSDEHDEKDRMATYFEEMSNISPVVGYKNSVAFMSYETVVGMMNEDAVEIVGTGTAPHCASQRDRRPLLDFPPLPPLDQALLSEIDDDVNVEVEPLRAVRRCAIRNMWARTWNGVEPSTNVLEALAAFDGSTCDLDAFLDSTLADIDAHGASMRDWVRESLLPMADLAISTIRRLRRNPMTYVALWKSDPLSFLVEESRHSPFISSVEALLKKDIEVDVATPLIGTGGASVGLNAGRIVHIVLSEANRDRDFFGGPSRSRRAARRFEPSPSRNARFLHFSGRTRRVLVGSRDALEMDSVYFDTVVDVVERFLPPVGEEEEKRYAS